MALQTRQVTLNSSTAVPILVGPMVDRNGSVYIRNDDAVNDFFVGPAGVTATTGFRVPKATTVGPFNFGSGDDVYAISAAGTPVAMVLTRA